MLYDNVLYNYTIAIGDNMTYQKIEDLQDSIENLGALLRRNLQIKGITTSNTDGLTTLIDKINDIEEDSGPSGFFADIGIFDSNNWTSPPIVADNKIILNESSTFACDNITFPSTFTAMFIITFYDSNNYLDAPVYIEPGPSDIGLSGAGRFEFPLIIKRNDNGVFEIECPITGDYWTRNTIDYFDFVLKSDNIVLSKFFYTDTYYSGYASDNDFDTYNLLTYNVIWDDNADIAALRPNHHPVILFKNDNIFEYHNVSNSSEYNSISYGGDYEDTYWGCWSNILHNDTNEYTWKTNDEYNNDIKDYIKIIGDGQNRVDRYILGNGNVWQSFQDNNTTLDENMPFYWKIGFDYDSENAQDGYIRIGPDNSINYIRVGKISGGNYLDLSGGMFSINDSSSHIHFELEFLGYTIDNNIVQSSYRLAVNNYKHTFNNSNDLNDTLDNILPHNLYKVIQSNNATITNLYYKDNSIAVLDRCKKDRTTLYGSSVALAGSSSNTLSFNNDEYLLSGTGGYFSGREITQLHGTENARLRVKIKLNTTSNGAFNQFLIICTDESTTYGTRIRNDKKFQHFNLSTEEDIYTHSSYYSDNWFYLEAKQENGNWTVTLYDDALNILATDTQTSSSLQNPKWYIGLQTEKGENYSVHIKEILAEKLEGDQT